MKKILLTISSVLLAANFAMAQATEPRDFRLRKKLTPSKPAKSASINTPLEKPVLLGETK